MASRRRERINELIKREVSKKIIAEVKDPRVGFVTVTRAEIHDDMSGADIFITVFGDDHPVEETLKVLNKMAGFFQKDLGSIMRTRLTPNIKFKRDIGTENNFGLDNLIKKARESDTDHLEPNESEDVEGETPSDELKPE